MPEPLGEVWEDRGRGCSAEPFKARTVEEHNADLARQANAEEPEGAGLVAKWLSTRAAAAKYTGSGMPGADPEATRRWYVRNIADQSGAIVRHLKRHGADEHVARQQLERFDDVEGAALAGMRRRLLDWIRELEQAS